MGKIKPILITGGAGFIGSHLVDLLQDLRISYIVLDNLSSGSKENIPAAINAGVFVYGDVNDDILLKELIQSTSCVIHLASVVGVKNVIQNPLKTIDSNINSVRLITEHCSRFKVPLVFISSSLVYPSFCGNSHPFSENDQVHAMGFHPVSLYASSKKIGELICEYYKERFGLNYIIFRPFNLIGIRQKSDSGMVIPSFIRSAIEKKVINIYGNGEQTRVFSDVREAVKLLWLLINNEQNYGQIFNLATTNYSISILKLAELIRDILNEPICIHHVPYKNVFGNSFIDVHTRVPSLNKLKDNIDLPVQKDLTLILKEIIDYEKDIKNKNNQILKTNYGKL